MAIFGKKKKEDFEDEDEDLEELEVKDLKPQNSRKRKELPKPWGSRERYTVLIFLLGTVLISATLAVSSRDWKLPGLPKLKLSSLPKLSLEFLKGEFRV
jgi:hypothetical protein